MVKMPKVLLEESKAMVRLYLFLRKEVGLRKRLSVGELKQLLDALKVNEKVLSRASKVI
ncbi:MAG: hypothetical protein WC436_05620 [Candidatus Babeliales bacterium]